MTTNESGGLGIWILIIILLMIIGIVYYAELVGGFMWILQLGLL